MLRISRQRLQVASFSCKILPKREIKNKKFKQSDFGDFQLLGEREQ